MQVDRSRFLFLVSAISAGCAPRHSAQAPTANVPAAGTPESPATAATESKAAYPPPIAEGGSAAEGTWPAPPSEGVAWPAPPSEGVAWPAPANEGGATWEGGPPAEGGGPAPTLQGMGIPVSSWKCNGSDDAGQPASCAVKVPASCAPFPFVHSSCKGALTHFKPKIAERAVFCMNKLKGDAVCNAMTYDCRTAALRSACADASADTFCQGLKQACPKMNQTECRVFTRGLNATGRAKVAQCMTGPGCGWGVYSCVEGLND